MAMHDVRYAVRRLRKQPLTSFVSIATLACAIGAAAATWSLISAVMLHPLHVSEPDRLVEVGYRLNPTSAPTSGFKYPASRTVLEAGVLPMAAWGSIASSTPLLVKGNDEPRVRSVRFTAPNFLEVLGLKPALGRFISEDEDRPGEPLVAVLSARFWKNEFNSDRGVVGRTIQVRDQPTRSRLKGYEESRATSIRATLSPPVLENGKDRRPYTSPQPCHPLATKKEAQCSRRANCGHAHRYVTCLNGEEWVRIP